MIILSLVYLYTSCSVPRLSKARVTFGKAGFRRPLLCSGSISVQQSRAARYIAPSCRPSTLRHSF